MTPNGESLALFPVDELRAKQTYYRENSSVERDVFGQLLIGYGKSSTFQLLPVA